MAFIEKLKGIIPASLFSSAFHYNIKLDFSTTKTKKTLFKVDHDNKLIHIFLNNLTPKQLKLLKSVLLEGFKDDNLSFISEDAIPLLEKLYKYNNKEDNRVLAFFKPILSNMDWDALRDSLFLRNEFNAKRNVSNLKTSIIARYGERGNIISNMCTAGYFELIMIPLFNSSSKEFYTYWDIAIDRGVAALFVNSRMNTSKIKDEIIRRVTSAKSYGLSSIHIHGIGKSNVKNIKDCIEKEKDNLNFTEKNLFTVEDLDILVVEILL